MRLAIFAAFPHELNRLRKNFGFGKKLEKGLFPLFSIRQRSCEIIAVQTGMRTDTLKAAFTHVREKYHPDMILSIGFCGALYSEAQIGDLVWASQYWHLLEGETNLTQGNAVMTVVPADFSSKKILEKLHAQIRFYEGSFITLSTWISKSRLIQAIPRDIPIPVCDRETYHLAQW